MKTLFTFFFCCIISSTYCQTDAGVDKLEQSLSALVSYNFLGGDNSSISNLTPEVFYGWNKGKKIYGTDFQIKVGPYVSGQIDIKDSAAYLPALMLQGHGGLVANSYIHFGADRHKFSISPLCLGLKFLSGFGESKKTLIQHNVRFALGYQYERLIALTMQYTIGWHGLTTQSEETYKEIFKTDKMHNAQYLNITLQTKIAKDAGEDENAWYLFVSWRSFINNKNDYQDLPNEKILSLGLRKTLDFTSGTPARVTFN